MPSSAAFLNAAEPGATAPDAATRLGLAWADNGDLLADLAAGPLTIGGGPRCSIRLESAGLRPLHCVITPTEQGPVVRRWAPETLLNGADFTEASLAAGDSLKVGPIELTVTDLAVPQPAPEEATPSEPKTGDATPGDTQAAAPLSGAWSQESPSPEPTSDAKSLTSPTPDSREADEAPLENNFPEEESEEDASADDSSALADAPDGASDRVSDSVDQIEQALKEATEVDADSTGEDPAIPQRLLQPWSPSTTPPAPADVAVETDVFATQEELSAPHDPNATKPLGGEWAVEPEAAAEPALSGPTTRTTTFTGDAAEFLEDESPWRVDAPAPEPAESPAEIDEDAAATFAAESAESTPAHPVAEEQDAPTPTNDDLLRGRLASDRRRVAGLVETLRDERAELEVLRTLVAQRDEAIELLRSELDNAVATAEEAGAELTRLAAAAEQDSSSEDDYAAASQRVDEVEQRVRAIENVALSDRRRETEETFADLVATQSEASELPTTEPGATGLESPDLEAGPAETVAPELDETRTEAPASDLWSLEPAPVAPTAQEPVTEQPVAETPAWGSHAETSEVPSTPAEESPEASQEAAPVESDEGESLWGIERLTGATPDASSLWGLSPEEPTDKPVEAVEPAEAEASLDFSATPAQIEFPEAETPEHAETPEPAVEPEADLSQVPAILLTEEEPAVGNEAYDEPVAAALTTEEPAEQDAIDEPEAIDEPAAIEPKSALFEPVAKPASDEPAPEPTSFIERYAHLIPDDDEPAPTPVEPVAEATAFSAPAEPEPIAAESDDEESIDEYMRKLMSRMRGSSHAEAPASLNPTPVVAAPVAEAPSNPAYDPSSLEALGSPKIEDRIRDLSEMKRASVGTPQPTTDIGALRQLANQSARHAINLADTRENREHAILRTTVSLVAIACGTFASVSAASPFDVQFGAGLLGVLGGGMVGVRTIRMCQTARTPAQLEAAVRARAAKQQD